MCASKFWSKRKLSPKKCEDRDPKQLNTMQFSYQWKSGIPQFSYLKGEASQKEPPRTAYDTHFYYRILHYYKMDVCKNYSLISPESTKFQPFEMNETKRMFDFLGDVARRCTSSNVAGKYRLARRANRMLVCYNTGNYKVFLYFFFLHYNCWVSSTKLYNGPQCI